MLLQNSPRSVSVFGYLLYLGLKEVRSYSIHLSNYPMWSCKSVCKAGHMARMEEGSILKKLFMKRADQETMKRSCSTRHQKTFNFATIFEQFLMPWWTTSLHRLLVCPLDSSLSHSIKEFIRYASFFHSGHVSCLTYTLTAPHGIVAEVDWVYSYLLQTWISFLNILYTYNYNSSNV